MSTETLQADDLQQSQEALGKALDKARAGDDKELAAEIRDTGERFVRQLFGAMRLTKTHDLENAAFEKPIQELDLTLSELIDLLGAVHLVSVEGQIYINDVRVRMDERMDIGGKLGQILRLYGIGGISFHGRLSAEKLRRFIEGFAGKPGEDGHSRLEMQKRLLDQGADTIELQGVYKLRISGETIDKENIDQHRLARNATGLVEATLDSLGASRMPNPLQIRRVVTEMLDVGSGTEGIWEEAADNDRFSAHTVRVSLLCMVIGRGLGLSSEAMQDLGVAAMFHDVGYAAREGAEPGREGLPGSPGYAPPFERHASAGARLILRQRGFHEAKIHRALATLEHHRDHAFPGQEQPTLFGRILRIAEAYDSLLYKSPDRPRPSTVLRRMQAWAGTRYDPIVLQVLVNQLGRWPPGSYLQLEDGRVVRVVGTARGKETWDRPKCRVVRGIDGSRPPVAVDIDLAEISVGVVGEV